MRNIVIAAATVLFSAVLMFGQPKPSAPAVQNANQIAVPETIPAKYEGGMFGFTQKETGTLRFDDANERLVFFGKDNKEKFSLPYDSIILATPTSKSVQSVAGTVAGAAIPLPGAGLASLIREKRRYVLIQFDDPDVAAQGTINFKVGDRAKIESVVRAVGQRAKLTQRGEAYYRPRKKTISGQ